MEGHKGQSEPQKAVLREKLVEIACCKTIWEGSRGNHTQGDDLPSRDLAINLSNRVPEEDLATRTTGFGMHKAADAGENVLVAGAWLEAHTRPRGKDIASRINAPETPSVVRAQHCELCKEKVLKELGCLFVELGFGAERQ